MTKRKKKKKKPQQMHKYYTKKGDKLERKNKFCVKCGPGYFLAQHTNRLTCGKCNYVEFT